MQLVVIVSQIYVTLDWNRKSEGPDELVLRYCTSLLYYVTVVCCCTTPRKLLKFITFSYICLHFLPCHVLLNICLA